MFVTSHTLKFAPSILSRLGEELLPNFDQGIIELVRNAYDADASECTVYLENIQLKGGRIIVKDNGVGMDEEAISSGWLVLGQSSKRGGGATEKGRIQVGDKGLGRLAALRMGTSTTLRSNPRKSKDTLLSAKLLTTKMIWDEFDSKNTVDEVSIEVKESAEETEVISGTEIIIEDLKNNISRAEVERLARSLMMLSNPFKQANDFKLKFRCPEYPEFERLVEEGYMEEYEYILRASVDDSGIASAELIDWKGESMATANSRDWYTSKSKGNPIYNIPPATFELLIYKLEQSSFATRNINKTQVAKWLKSVGGVHIYQNKFRVHPYGDEGSDWLDMNLARVNKPKYHPSTNTSIGRVEVFDENKVLQQKTDRVGFIENEAFLELRRFAKDALNWYTSYQQKRDSLEKSATRSKDSENAKKKKVELNKAINEVKDQTAKSNIKRALKEAEKANAIQTRHLKEDLKLYRSLATAGTTTAVFSHEVSKPLDEIPVSLKSAQLVVERNCSGSVLEQYRRRANNILRYLDRLSHFAKLQMDLLKKSKRRDGVINVNNVVTELVNSFKPLLERENILINMRLEPDSSPKLLGSTCILEAIITNCFTNSMRAFQRNGFHVESRVIDIDVSVNDSLITIHIGDNGPGICDIDVDDIWIPGRTTLENGTGFGLTIVKDSVSDLSGSCRVVPNGNLGGASFYFEFKVA